MGAANACTGLPLRMLGWFAEGVYQSLVSLPHSLLCLLWLFEAVLPKLRLSIDWLTGNGLLLRAVCVLTCLCLQLQRWFIFVVFVLFVFINDVAEVHFDFFDSSGTVDLFSGTFEQVL